MVACRADTLRVTLSLSRAVCELMCQMTVVRLTSGCLLYSPVLGPDDTLAAVLAGLDELSLLPVRVVVAPSPQHHLALAQYQVST